MSKPRLFQYTILWHPTDEEKKNLKNNKSLILVRPTEILATDEKAAAIAAAVNIPGEYKQQLDQIEIALRPF